MNISISITIRRMLMLMPMSRLSSLAHKLLMLMVMLMLASLVDFKSHSYNIIANITCKSCPGFLLVRILPFLKKVSRSRLSAIGSISSSKFIFLPTTGGAL